MRIGLLYQYLPFRPVPPASPWFIGPTQTKWQVGCPGPQNFVEWPFEQSPALEPIVIIAKAVHPILLCHIRLSFPGLWQAQVVKAKISRQVRLVMSAKPRPSFHNIRPLRKPLAPPLVIFGYGMVLRKVKGYEFGTRR
jgi:hypothetical protein